MASKTRALPAENKAPSRVVLSNPRVVPRRRRSLRQDLRQHLRRILRPILRPILIRDHDNFIIVLQKNQELDKNIDDTSNLSKRLIIKNFKLSPDRTIKIVYDNCKNITKNYFDCNNGYLQELDNKMDYAKYIDIKNQGYTKIIMILTYAPANYKSVFDSIKILDLELTVIFIMDYLNSQLSYILENMLYDLKNKYNFQVLLLNHDETDKYIDTIDKITTFVQKVFFNYPITCNTFHNSINDTFRKATSTKSAA